MKSISLENAARTLSTGQHVEARTRLPFKPVDVPPLVDPEDNVVLGGDDRQLHCYSPEGAERWSAPLSSSLTHTPARDEQGNLYVAHSITVQAFSPEGEPLWESKAPWTLAGTPQPLGDKVYIGTTSGELLEFDENGRCRSRGNPWKAPVPLYVSPGPEGALIVTRPSGDMMVYKPDALLFKKGRSRPLPGMLKQPPTPGPGGKLYLSCMAPGMRYSLATIDPATAELEVVARFKDFQPISLPGVGPAGVAIAVAGEGIRVYDQEGAVQSNFPARTDSDMVPWTGRAPRVVSAAPGSMLVTDAETGTVALGRDGAFTATKVAQSGLTPPIATSGGRYVVASYEGELLRISPDPVLTEEAPQSTTLEHDLEEQILRIGPIELAIED